MSFLAIPLVLLLLPHWSVVSGCEGASNLAAEAAAEAAAAGKVDEGSGGTSILPLEIWRPSVVKPGEGGPGTRGRRHFFKPPSGHG